MIPRSAADGQQVNSRKADEVVTEHGPWRPDVMVSHGPPLFVVIIALPTGP